MPNNSNPPPPEPWRHTTDLTADDIRRVADAIREGEVHFTSGEWLVTIGPHHLDTSEARGKLWVAIERLVQLDEELERC
jgi:hypothetical protein